MRRGLATEVAEQVTDGQQRQPAGRRRRRSAVPRRGRPDHVLKALRDQLPDAARLDLSRFSEETRRDLYALAVAAYWSRRGEADDYEIPTFSPEQAELTVHYFCRRWFVTWTDLDQRESAPIEDRQPLLHIERNAGRPLGLSFTPC